MLVHVFHEPDAKRFNLQGVIREIPVQEGMVGESADNDASQAPRDREKKCSVEAF